MLGVAQLGCNQQKSWSGAYANYDVGLSLPVSLLY